MTRQLVTVSECSRNACSAPKTFTAIDVETANADRASICQIGIVRFEDGVIVDEWQSLVNPEDYFDSMNVFIHGISEAMVVEAPTWPQIASEIDARLQRDVVVCHTSFDRISVARAHSRYGVATSDVTWLDSARVARRAWPNECGAGGYGLKALAKLLALALTHHDALADARTAGWIVCRAIDATGHSLTEWLARVEHPVFNIVHSGNPDGPLAGEVLVFTGALAMVRGQAASLAAAVGCGVDQGVTRRTTLLVVGDQDLSKLAGHDKSNKHRKAEELNRAGQLIRILTESDFLRLISIETAGADSAA
jgi:DNA polymerase-3 subunit epsilon